MVATDRASVYLKGEGTAYLVDLAPLKVLHMLREASVLAESAEAGDLVFVPLPMRSGEDGYFRPDAVAAVLPGWWTDEYDDDDYEDD